MAANITVQVKQESSQTVAITVNGPDKGLGPELIGYLEITAVPRGARVEGWNADDTEVGSQLILHGESQ